MNKRLIAFLLVFAMLLPLLPMNIFAAAEDIVTITVVDANGDPVSDATVTVVRTYRSFWTNRTQNVTVTNAGNGTYTYDTSRYTTGTTQYYTVNVQKKVGTTTYTDSEQVAADTRSVVITLSDFVPADQWETFDIYYIADGHFPESFYGHGEPADYGPAGDDTPLLTINVNVTKLKSTKYADVVLYQENVSNAYHFIPANNSDSKDATVAYEENLTYAKAFWDAVVECMDEASVAAFKATGLYNTFVGYCLKNQGSAANPDRHGDGILTVEPPVYVIEMYDHEGAIFGGFSDDQEDLDNKTFTTIEEVLSAYNVHFNQSIDWSQNEAGTWEGYYITTDASGRKFRYDLQIVQTNYKNVNYTSHTGLEYEKKTNTYYLAAFQSATVNVEQVAFTITYTDGLTEVVFNDQVTAHAAGQAVPSFRGDTYRENFVFLGWVLQGGDGQILSQQDILNQYTGINRDMTFVAVYEVAPEKYNAIVETVVDGSYNSYTGTATGERVDIEEIKAGVSLHISADGVNYIPLEKTATGVYSAQVENGTYKIYFYNGATYKLASDQHLSINNSDRTRYLFFTSVTYDLNGGVGGPSPLKNYYITGSTVYVATEEPTREGYIFKGWKNVYGQVYAPGSLLSSSIAVSEVLTAQWEKLLIADVNVTLHIKHYPMNGAGVDPNKESGDLMINLVYRANENEPYVEVVGDKFIMVDENWYAGGVHSGTDQNPETTLTYEGVFTELPVEYLYSANIFLDDYYIINRTVTTETDSEGNITYLVEAEMMYEPTLFNLTYQTVVDESVPDAWIPKAVDIKVISWDAQMAGRWAPISRHTNYSADVEFGGDDSRRGEGSYPVPVFRDSDGSLYYYRVVPVGFTLADGTELTATPNADGTVWYSDAGGGYPAGAFWATVEIIDGDAIDGTTLTGVHGYDDPNSDDITKYLQHGNILVTVYSKLYDVQFLPNGGTLNGSADAAWEKEQMFVPNLENYVPVRDGGYVFDGWYLADENGNITQQTITSGEALTGDITLIAKWKEPLTIEGLLTVGATYEQENADGSVTIQKINDIDFAPYAIVILQRIDPNGYTETVREMTVDLTYYNEAYYFQGRNVGVGYYSFDEIPDDGTQYRIQLLLPNYHPTFQNEDESLDENLRLTYNTYNTTDFTALWGETAPAVATVNIHAHFHPESFRLEYQVDSTQIGKDFRPESVELLVTYDGEKGNVVPSTWPVISHMIFGDKLIGDTVVMNNGMGYGTDDVWIRRSDGRTYYQYGIRVYNTTTNGVKTAFGEDAPFTVTYQDPAYFNDIVQSQDLIATLVPKQYAIHYVTNGGVLPADYPTVHTWSYATDIGHVEPTFTGFQFLGWYYDEALTQPADNVIDPSIAGDVTLYAKWLQVMDTVDLTVIIHHTQLDNPDGLAANYDKTLYTQLTYAPRTNDGTEHIYADMAGYSRVYPNGQWHTNGDNVLTDTFQVPHYYNHLSAAYDYSVNVMLDGYYVQSKTTEKEVRPDGSTLHHVIVELQYYPDLFDLEFYVQMKDSVPTEAYPESAEVKVTSWGDDPAEDSDWDWVRITQHRETTLTVHIDPQTGYGTGSYPVWHWYNEEEGDPYHYRIEVIQLNMKDGSVIPMNETLTDVRYAGGGYTAEIVTDEDCAIPEVPRDENEAPQAITTLAGAYGAKDGDGHKQMGKVGAEIDLTKVVFHANLNAYTGNDVVRTYYPAGAGLAEGYYSLTQDGKIESFYEIPELEYLTNNSYIFKGWYLDKESDARPISWQDVYTGSTDIYAHWITVEDVAKEDDGKETGSQQYAGFDLIGAQIRPDVVDNDDHYQGGSVTSGTQYSGLRFITVLSEDVYQQINGLNSRNGSGAEYGFAVAKSNTAAKYAGDAQGYTLQYKGANVNGVNTTTTYKYVNNMVCNGVLDHYNGEAYRLYTAVITYKGVEGDALAAAQATPFVARSYIRYYDANGLLRTYYNNYTGTPYYNGCNTSYTDVAERMGV